MDMLSTLFGSDARVKIMRLFLFNPEMNFDVEMVSRKSKVSPKMVRKEFSVLQSANFIKTKIFYKTVEKKIRGKSVEKKIKSRGFYLNERFHYLSAFKQLLINTKTLDNNAILRQLSKAGRLTFVVISGVFTHNPDSRVDMLVVGNNLNKTSLIRTVGAIEAELGKELVYAYFETPDFQYRLGMYDKLIRDIMDYPHQVLLDKINLK
jgi:hypothetical protein